MASTRRDQDMTVYPVQAAVRSQSDGTRSYMVTLPHCPCADFTNRRGMLIPVDEHTMGVTICKHLAEALERVGGWHRTEPEPVLYPRLTRNQAVTVMTSAFLSADLTDRLLRAAVGAAGVAVAMTIATGSVLVKYDNQERRYYVTLPAGQPVVLPA